MVGEYGPGLDEGGEEDEGPLGDEPLGCSVMKEVNKHLIKVNKQLTREVLTDPLRHQRVPTPPQLRETILELAEHLEDC